MFLHSNDISDVVLPVLPQLTDLTLNSNMLTSLQDLPQLPALKKLDLGSNPQLTPSALAVLKATTPLITELVLNAIDMPTTPDGLPFFNSLTTLDIGDNGLTSLSGLPPYPNLTDLRLADNQLATFTQNQVPMSVNTLDLDNNNLDSTSLEAISQHMVGSTAAIPSTWSATSSSAALPTIRPSPSSQRKLSP